MFEILFYRWRIFLQLRVQNELTTRIQKKIDRRDVFL